MTLPVWLAFVVACFVFSLSPGAGAVSTMSASLCLGPRRALANILGLQLALSLHILVVAAGLGVLLSSSVWAFTALKLAGALYLIWLGVQKWRETPVLAVPGVTTPETGPWRLVRTGLLVNLTNPKSIVFLAAWQLIGFNHHCGNDKRTEIISFARLVNTDPALRSMPFLRRLNYTLFRQQVVHLSGARTLQNKFSAGIKNNG